MAGYSKKVMGKEVGDAKIYAAPHDMNGKSIAPSGTLGPNQSRADQYNMSVGNINKSDGPGPKTSGIKMRGTGAATKGTMSRGPMA